MTKKLTVLRVATPPQPRSPIVGTGAVVGASSKSILDAGYFYAPYIPLYVTPTVVASDFSMPGVVNSPLEDFVEEVFKEEIESGELKTARSNSRSKRYARYDKMFINPKFYSTVTITNL